MRWSATLGGWNRRKSVLAACLAAAAALAALAVPLKLPWLGVAGLVVAAVGAMASLVISTEQARLEGKRERAELDRRVKVPVAPITEIDPTQIGVDPAATQTMLGGTVPEYVGREIDAELGKAIEAALTGAGSWMLVVDGPSKVGKSRTLFEALSQCSVAERLQLVAPVHGEALRSLLDPGQPMATRPEYAVLWLDDLEPFLSQGVTLQTLREWRASRPGWIVAATYGGKGSELVAEAATGGLKTLAADILLHAREIALHATSSKEIGPLRGAALGCRLRRGAPSRAGRLPGCRSSPSAQAHDRAARTRGAGVPGRGGGGVCRRRLGPVRTHRPDQRRHASGVVVGVPTGGDDAQRRAFCHRVGVGVAAGRRDGSPAAARRPRVPRL